MENPRPEKVAAVTEVRERLDATDAAILTEYRGLNVDQLADLRGRLRDVGGEYTVYKNSLVRFAARDLELEIEELLTGPTAIAFVGTKPDGESADAVDVAKVLRDFGNEHPALVLKGTVLAGKLLDVEQTRALADVEPREVLLAKLAGGMAAPMQKFAGLLQALPRNFAYGLKALLDQGGAAGAPAEAPSAAGETADEGSEAPAAADETADDGAEAPAASDEAAPETAESTPSETAEAPADADTPTEENQES